LGEEIRWCRKNPSGETGIPYTLSVRTEEG